jgi:D-amino-acid oxidase
MSSWNLDRRRLIQASLALGGLSLGGFAAETRPRAPLDGAGLPRYVIPSLAPVRVDPTRLFDITVSTSPFRAQGPRIETEQIANTLVVHNYGHGGSGWSLSWGSANLAIRKALVNGLTRVGVIGCGVIGLTSAIMAQRAGAQVTIYARDLLPQTPSSQATGRWTPDLPIAPEGLAAHQFGALWEEMARFSFKTHCQYRGLRGEPVEWRGYYALSDVPFDHQGGSGEELKSSGLVRDIRRIADLIPSFQDLPARATPFPVRFVRRYERMQFNIADYGHILMSEFFTAGGKFERKEFHAPSELTQLDEKVVINCPGHAAREWWNDNSIVPLRGQIAWLAPQHDVDYGINYKGISMLSRRDGIVLENNSNGERHELCGARADRAEADHAVRVMAQLFSRFRA